MKQRPKTAAPEVLYGVPITELARICRVSERTARRWKNGVRRPPQTALMIVAADLGAQGPVKVTLGRLGHKPQL